MPVVATGGTESESGGYKIHKFTGDGTFIVTSAGDVEYLVVAGGGSGGKGAGACGGGGAGGVKYGTLSLSTGNKDVIVGDGGAAITGANAAGNNGEDSQFDSVTATHGGGGGGSGSGNSKAGGSGGGGAGYLNTAHADGTGSEGFAGGDGSAGSYYAAGGGGGAGAVGESAIGSSRVSGGGGAGVSTYSDLLVAADAGVDISGVHWIAGGGGGGADAFAARCAAGAGGNGGGGTGSDGTNAAAGGIANTGSGGGGGGRNAAATINSASGAGGSGVVIIRYLLPEAPPEGPPAGMPLYRVDAMEALIRSSLEEPSQAFLTSAIILQAINDGYKDVTLKALCIECEFVTATLPGNRLVPFLGHRVNHIIPALGGDAASSCAGCGGGGGGPGGGGGEDGGGGGVWIPGGGGGGTWTPGTPETPGFWTCYGCGISHIEYTSQQVHISEGQQLNVGNPVEGCVYTWELEGPGSLGWEAGPPTSTFYRAPAANLECIEVEITLKVNGVVCDTLKLAINTWAGHDYFAWRNTVFTHCTTFGMGPSYIAWGLTTYAYCDGTTIPEDDSQDGLQASCAASWAALLVGLPNGDVRSGFLQTQGCCPWQLL